MNDPKDDLGPQIDKLERILEKLPKYIPQNSVSSASFTINGGSVLQMAVTGIACIVCAVVFALYLSDRSQAAAEKLDMRSQARADISSLKSDIKDLKDKSETQQAYINEMYRSLKK